MSEKFLLKCIIYCILLLFYAVLFVLSRHEKAYSDEKLFFLEVPFRKAAVYLYRKYRCRGRSDGSESCSSSGHAAESAQNKTKIGKTGRIIDRIASRLRIPGKDAVKSDLKTLTLSKLLRKREILYFLGKLTSVLVFIFVADVLALVVLIEGYSENVIKNGSYIERSEYGGGAFTVSAKLDTDETDRSDEEKKEQSDVYVFTVNEKSFTKEEEEAFAQKLFSLLPELIKGSNSSIGCVNSNLDLVREADGFPFEISWESSDYERVYTDGSVNSAGLEKGESLQVVLTALLSGSMAKYEHEYTVTLIPKTLTEEELFRADVEAEIADKEQNSRNSGKFYLPREVDGKKLYWMDDKKDISVVMFVLVVFAGAVEYFLSDRKLHKKILERERQLTLDYPQIVSKLILYIGAGMSVRNAFCKLGEDYGKRIMKGGEKRYVYEEIILVCNELNSGISEYEVYSNFGVRCKSRQYTKLCSLLTQNLKRGNRELLKILQEEADSAFLERRSIARQLGEEAGTKMLLPMLLMLADTMVIIMIPAYLSFTV